MVVNCVPGRRYMMTAHGNPDVLAGRRLASGDREAGRQSCRISAAVDVEPRADRNEIRRYLDPGKDLIADAVLDDRRMAIACHERDEMSGRARFRDVYDGSAIRRLRGIRIGRAVVDADRVAGDRN